MSEAALWFMFRSVCFFLFFMCDYAGLYSRLAPAGSRTGLQVTDGVIYATITLGMACFHNLSLMHCFSVFCHMTKDWNSVETICFIPCKRYRSG